MFGENKKRPPKEENSELSALAFIASCSLKRTKN
jgi:hypothetical protein